MNLFQLELIDETLIQCNDTAHHLIIDGYRASRTRLNWRNCGHFTYPSVNVFINRIQSLYEKYKTATSQYEFDQINAKMSKLVDNGVCKSCCLFILTNMKTITKYNEKFVGPRHKHSKITFQYFTFWDTEIMGNYFEHCLRYQIFADLILNRSRLWNELFVSLNGNMSKLESTCMNVIQQTQNDKIPNQIIVNYKQTTLLLFQVIRNIHLFNHKLWTVILKIRGMHLQHWLPFIEKQICHGLYSKSSYGIKCLYCFLIILCFAMHQMKRLKHKHNHIQLYDLKRITHWINNLKSIYEKSIAWRDDETDLLMSAFMLLKNESSADNMYKSFRLLSKKVCKEKKNDVECQNGKCRMRKRHGKMYKCGGCRVVRYCCKKCQKYDWNKNYHKLYCKKLQKMWKHRLKVVCDCHY
eukprot:170093_1